MQVCKVDDYGVGGKLTVTHCHWQAIATMAWAYGELKHFDDDLFEALAVRGVELLHMPRSQPADSAGDVPSTQCTSPPRPMHGSTRVPAVSRLLDAPQVLP